MSEMDIRLNNMMNGVEGHWELVSQVKHIIKILRKLPGK